jgi:hypothetical protein
MVDQATDDESTVLGSPFDLASHNNIAPPNPLYKYFKYPPVGSNEWIWTQDIFTKNEIYLAAPKAFNDPFDSVTRYTYPRSPAERERLLKKFVCLHRLPIAEQAIRGWVRTGADIPYMDEVCEELTYQMKSENAVFCMTEKRDNILMWAHYAGQHTGFCLEFGTDNPLFSRVRPVIYSRCHPKDDLEELLMAKVRPLPLYLVTKAEDWAYEKEWRLGDPGPGPGPREYPPESLTGVILGCRMEEKNKEQITEWCREREPRPTFYEAKERRSEFGLDIIPITY